MINEYVVIDLEMTGLSPIKDKIIEVAAIKVINGIIKDEYSQLVNPNVEISEKVREITGISNKMTKSAKYIEEIMQEILHFIEGMTLVGHNIQFDFSFIMQNAYVCGYKDYTDMEWYGIDTLKLSRKYLPSDVSKTLKNLCEMYKIQDDNHHRALNDVKITKELYSKLCDDYEKPDNMIMPERLTYKPKKDRPPSAKQIEYVKKLLAFHNIQPEYSLEKMTQSELNRYADKIVLRHGRMKI